MANTIRIKRRASGGAGAPASLQNAELAYNEVNDVLYYGKGTGGAGGSATTVEAIAGLGAYVGLTGDQTIGGNKTFSNTITGSISGNAGTASKWQTARNLALTGDITATLTSVDGSGNVSAAATLATVNSNVGTFTKVTVNGKGLVTAATSASLSDLSAPTASVAWGGFQITNLADPTAAQDAATKNYVDSVAQGLDAKQSVKAATTGNITLMGPLTIDGVSVVAGDRVLVKNQTLAAQNGIYVVASTAWTRSTDMDSWAEVPSAFVFVEQGTTLAESGWVCTSDGGGSLGTSAINWAQFSSAGTYSAGNGLQLTGNTFSVLPDGTSLSVSAAGTRISATYAGQTSITTVGTIGTGTWQGTTVAVGFGGTGATTFTSNGVVYGNGTGALQASAAGTWDATNSVGQLLSVNASGVPTWTNTIDGGTF